jgi:hypothetical protein
MLLAYSGLALTTIALLVGLRAGTWDGGKTGFLRCTAVGWLMLVTGLAGLAAIAIAINLDAIPSGESAEDVREQMKRLEYQAQAARARAMRFERRYLLAMQQSDELRRRLAVVEERERDAVSRLESLEQQLADVRLNMDVPGMSPAEAGDESGSGGESVDTAERNPADGAPPPKPKAKAKAKAKAVDTPPVATSGDKVIARGEVLSDAVNIREGPGPEFKIIHYLKKGRVFDILDRKENWLYVNTPLGNKGWLYGRYVKQTPVQ